MDCIWVEKTLTSQDLYYFYPRTRILNPRPGLREIQYVVGKYLEQGEHCDCSLSPCFFFLHFFPFLSPLTITYHPLAPPQAFKGWSGNNLLSGLIIRVPCQEVRGQESCNGSPCLPVTDCLVGCSCTLGEFKSKQCNHI